MSLKLSKTFEKENKLTEEVGDFDKALGKVLFLSAEPVMIFEDYMPEGEDGELRSRPTDNVDYYEVNIYSEGQGKQIAVKMPAETKFEGLNYEDEVKLTDRSLNFWQDKEIVSTGNGQFRTNYFSGEKWNAREIEKVNKNQNAPIVPKSENNEHKK